MNITSNISAPFIRQACRDVSDDYRDPVGGRYRLPVFCRLPRCLRWTFPPSQVSASLPGASAETMASAVATPLERQFGRIASVTQMTSSSSLGSTSITLQFDLNRDINAAARDVQAGINAARGQLPADLPGEPELLEDQPSGLLDHDSGAGFGQHSRAATLMTPPTRSWRKRSPKCLASAK